MTKQDTTTPDTMTQATPDQGAVSLDHSLAEDAAAAFAGDDQQEQEQAQQAEQDGGQPYIRRVDDAGNETRFAIMTQAEFHKMFCLAFDGPQLFHPAFRHIATDNGVPLRAEGAAATSATLYGLCRTSGLRWLESILALDGSGIEKLMQWGLVGIFAIGTLQGAGAAMRELRQGPPQAQGQGTEGADGETGGPDTQNTLERATGGADGVPDWARKPAGGAA